MVEFMYVLKMLGVSAVVVFCMQVNVGGKSIENHFGLWMRTSSLTTQLNQIAHGAVLGGKRGAEKVSQFVSQTIGKKEPQVENAGRLNIQLKRSDAYEREQAAKAAHKEAYISDDSEE